MQLEHKRNEQKQQQPATLRSHAKCASANITGAGVGGVYCVYMSSCLLTELLHKQDFSHLWVRLQVKYYSDRMITTKTTLAWADQFRTATNNKKQHQYILLFFFFFFFCFVCLLLLLLLFCRVVEITDQDKLEKCKDLMSYSLV